MHGSSGNTINHSELKLYCEIWPQVKIMIHRLVDKLFYPGVYRIPIINVFTYSN